MYAKDLKGREFPKEIYQRKDGRYEAGALINGIRIQLYNFNLKKLKVEFEKRKEEAKQGADKKLSNITLDEWFEEWLKYRANFGRLIGNMKVTEIRNMDIQDVINTMQQEGRVISSMRDALGRVRECLESAKNNRIISENPCFDINITVPWENVSKERRFLSQGNRFLQQVEDNWYKEMFYIMFLTGMRIGEVGGLKWEDVDFKNKCININCSLSCQYDSGVKTVRLTEIGKKFAKQPGI